MKSTKHAYAKIWQNNPENKHEDTTTTPYDHKDTNELNSIPGNPPIPAGIPYARQQHEQIQHSRILPYNRTIRPHRLRQNPPEHAQQNQQLLNTHETHHRKPEPANSIPPAPYYPRHGTLTRPNTTQHCTNKQPENNTEHYQQIPETHKNNPDPPSCHNHGQRFKQVSQNQLAYKHQNNHANTPHTPKPKTKTQPTFDLTEPNQ